MADRAAILAARKERKAAAKAAKKDKSARPRRGPSRKGCGVPPAVVDAIDALELAPVSVEVAHSRGRCEGVRGRDREAPTHVPDDE